MKTPLLLIAGYLGAGKTTLLKHILKNTDKKVAILMNEFGEIGIDTVEIEKENVSVKELLEGCVCCSLQGELEAGLKEIIKDYTPDMIIVETTGIAEADNLVLSIDEDIDFVSLDAVITVVDADIMQRFPEVSGSAEIQIRSADLLLLNKIDLIKDITVIKKKLRKINPQAPIIETEHCKVDLKILLSVEAEHHHITKSNHHHHMESFSLETKELTEKKLRHFLETLPKDVFRVKGYINIEGKTNLVNYVGGRITMEESEGKKVFVFIGEGIKKKKNEITLNLQTA
ncbi:GTP-binding protein [Candidatus Woesearchaeota archaeon]|nr:GTP-binding protein [Candidatus Woesearchaeota archaeon]